MQSVDGGYVGGGWAAECEARASLIRSELQEARGRKWGACVLCDKDESNGRLGYHGARERDGTCTGELGRWLRCESEAGAGA